MRLKQVSISGLMMLALFPAGTALTQSREGSSFDQAKFVPDIAFILDMAGVGRDISNERYGSLAIPGFSYPFVSSIGLDGSNAHRGWNFNYGELSLYSVVDPYFDMFAVIGLSSDAAGLEEAYFQTRKLPYGLQVKAGKFLASFGRINEQHEHYWDFANRPLIAEALFGQDGLNEIGAQLTWVPPTSFYLAFGAEVLTGDNDQSFGTTGIHSPSGGVSIDPLQGPNLTIGWVRTSFDVGDASFLLGLSNALGTTRTDQGFSSGVSGQAVDASTDIVGGDVTMKYALDAIRYLSFQSEYMYRIEKGTDYIRDGSGVVTTPGLEKHNAGFYAEAVAKLDLRWRIGIRTDVLLQNDVTLGTMPQAGPSGLPRYSMMIEYSPTEFSRLRLQADRDLSRYLAEPGGWSRQAFDQVILQANLTIGAHGAHAF